MKPLTSIHESLMDVAKERVMLFYPERQLFLYCRGNRLKVRGYRYHEIDLGVCTLTTFQMFCALFGIDQKACVFEERDYVPAITQVDRE
jgi:hypothetical protein